MRGHRKKLKTRCLSNIRKHVFHTDALTPGMTLKRRKLKVKILMNLKINFIVSHKILLSAHLEYSGIKSDQLNFIE